MTHSEYVDVLKERIEKIKGMKRDPDPVSDVDFGWNWAIDEVLKILNN